LQSLPCTIINKSSSSPLYYDKINIANYYSFLTRGTTGGLGSLQNNFGILSSINIRGETFLVASTVAMAILLIVEVIVLLGLMPVFQFIPSITIILIPIPIILMLILILGVSYMLSIVNLFLRDIQTIWGVAVHALFFISPIFWYLEDVEGILLSIQAINPVGQLIELNHKIIVWGEIPPLSDWLYTTMFVFGFLFVGYAIFHKFEKRIVEVI